MINPGSVVILDVNSYHEFRSPCDPIETLKVDLLIFISILDGRFCIVRCYILQTIPIASDPQIPYVSCVQLYPLQNLRFGILKNCVSTVR